MLVKPNSDCPLLSRQLWPAHCRPTCQNGLGSCTCPFCLPPPGSLHCTPACAFSWDFVVPKSIFKTAQVECFNGPVCFLTSHHCTHCPHPQGQMAGWPWRDELEQKEVCGALWALCFPLCLSTGCYNRIAGTGWLINNRTLSLSSRVWKSKIKTQQI